MSIQDRANHHISQLDKELSRYPALQDFEQRSSVPKVYLVLGLGALYSAFVFFNIAGEFLVNVAGFVIPGYYSLEALFSSSTTDDTQWLTYWVSFGFLTVLESTVNAIYWFPFYYTFKFILVIWMAIPQFGGAKIVFNSLLAPLFGRFFHQSGSTSQNLRSTVDQATKSQ